MKSEGRGTKSVLFEAKKYQKADKGKGTINAVFSRDISSSKIDTFMENFSEVYLLSVILSTEESERCCLV